MMTVANQMITVIITSRKSKKISLEHTVGTYRSSRKTN